MHTPTMAVLLQQTGLPDSISSPSSESTVLADVNTNRVNTLHIDAMTSLAPDLHVSQSNVPVQPETALSASTRISQHDVTPTADRLQPSIDAPRFREASEHHPVPVSNAKAPYVFLFT